MAAREAEAHPVSAENRPRPMTPEEVKATIQAELGQATSYYGGTIATRRKKARDYYLGLPYGDEVEGYSQVETQELLESVERIKPALMRIFTAGDVIARYLPRYNYGEPYEICEARAEQATDYMGRRFESSGGFRVLLTAFHDALLEALGIVKVVCEKKVSRCKQQFSGLSTEELAMLLSDPGVVPVEYQSRLEIVDPRMIDPQTGQPLPMQLHDVSIVRTSEDRDVVWQNVPPEHFLHTRGAYGLDESIPFVADRRRMKRSDLLAMGFNPDLVFQIPEATSVGFDDAHTSRYRDEGGLDFRPQRTDVASQEVWVTDCYVLLDEDGDGYSERRRILCGGDVGGVTILDDHEISEHPYCDFVPIPLSHKVTGLGLYDVVGQVQRTRSVLLRQVMDFVYLQNAPPTEVVDGMVNPDDLTKRRPGGYMRVKEIGAINPHPPQNLPPGVFDLLGLLKAEADARAGVSSASMLADPDTAKNATAEGTYAWMNAAAIRVDLIARIFAETGIKQMFKKALRCIVEYPPKATILKLRGVYVPIDPRNFDPEMGVEIDVTLGAGQTGQRVGALKSIVEWQMKLKETGSRMVDEKHVYNSLSRLFREAGFKYPESFIANPDFVPPPPPPPPDPKMIEVMDQSAKRHADIARDQTKLAIQAHTAEASARSQMLQAVAAMLQAEASVENTKNKEKSDG
jgi:hypothetical protein